MGKLRVAVLMGGRSAEREVSLMSGRRVLESLDPERYDAFCIDVATLGLLAGGAEQQRETRAHLDAGPGPSKPQAIPGDAFSTSLAPADQLVGAGRPDVALICLHGQYGEDGTIQGMLELMGIPYTGSGVLASALAMDKAMSKKIFRLEGIPTPHDAVLTGRDEADRFLAGARAGTASPQLPVVVKPNEQGSTIGTSLVHEIDELATALDTALAFDRRILVETLVEGVEITAAVLGNEELTVLPLVEIVPSTGFYDYERKYTPGATEEIVPARIRDDQAERARELALRCHKALGCRGLSRTDMIVTEDEVWVLEVNTIPGMTETSLVPRAASAAGIPFAELVERLVHLALEGRSTQSRCNCPA